MTIQLDHTIIPSKDKEAAATFFARIFGLRYDGPTPPFAPVQVNDSLTLDFRDAEDFDRHHYAFKISEPEFDAIFDRIKTEGLAYGSGPRSPDDMRINTRNGGRGLYFRDPDGHLLEILTA